MKRLINKNEINEILNDMAKGEKCYWRYQGAHHNGMIPVGHQSHERIYETDEPEYTEAGVSCYDNPVFLANYLADEDNDLDETDVVLFLGRQIGTGIDDEDIVEVTEEADIQYSLSLRNFIKWTLETNYIFTDRNGKQFSFSPKQEYSKQFLEYLFEK